MFFVADFVITWLENCFGRGFEPGSFSQNVAIAAPERDFSSSYRQVLYGGLSLVIVSFIWSSSSGENAEWLELLAIVNSR